MNTIVSNEIRIINPTPYIIDWCYNNLVLTNPEYTQLKIMGKEDFIKWKHIDEKLHLFALIGNELRLPFGCLYAIYDMIKPYPMELRFNNAGDISFKNDKIQGIDGLYDYQEEAIEYMIKAKGGVIYADCSAGKTIMGMELIKRIGKKALWICHTGDLLRQAKKDLQFLYPNAKIGLTTEGKVEIGEDITISTVQTLVKVDPSLYADKFDVVFVDECMPANTKIATPFGYKDLQSMSNGDIVYSYNSNGELEEQPITHLFKHIPKDLYCIKLANNEKIICTGNHPVYVKDKGYISASEVQKNDYVMQLLWEGVRHNDMEQVHSNTHQKKGMGLLQQSMYESGSKSEDCHIRRNSTKISREYDKTEQDGFERKKNRETTVGRSHTTLESQSKKGRIQFFCKGRERKSNSGTPNENVFGVRRKGSKLLFRVSDTNKTKKRVWISNLLQGRYCNSRIYDRDRSRWVKSFTTESASERQEERRFFNWIRVDDNQIQEQTADGTFGGLCPDGYVYNIEVAVNNNYFANDYLVHNCHHTVSSPSKMQMFGSVISKIPARYKYGLTATPERADKMTKSMYAYLGCNVKGEFKYTFGIDPSVLKKMLAEHKKIEINSGYTEQELMWKIYDTSGMLDYNALVTEICNNNERTEKIIDKVVECQKEGRKQVLLSMRVEHCEYIVKRLQERGIKAMLCVGKVSAKKRDEILNQKVEWDVIVATYALLKEGISIKELDTLHLTGPAKESGLIKQCKGRIERYKEGKKQPIIYDYVDMDIPYCVNAFKQRQYAIRKKYK